VVQHPRCSHRRNLAALQQVTTWCSTRAAATVNRLVATKWCSTHAAATVRNLAALQRATMWCSTHAAATVKNLAALERVTTWCSTHAAATVIRLAATKWCSTHAATTVSALVAASPLGPQRPVLAYLSARPAAPARRHCHRGTLPHPCAAPRPRLFGVISAPVARPSPSNGPVARRLRHTFIHRPSQHFPWPSCSSLFHGR